MKPSLPPSLAGMRIHLVGAKGTGMTALAELLSAEGAELTGSDVPDEFYTDRILAAIGVPVSAGFEASRVADARLVVHSAAYSRDSNPELAAAVAAGIPVMNYPEALGSLSGRYDSSGIAGVHGKTTTTAMAGCVAAALGLPATVLAGSAVASFGGRSTLRLGDRFFVAETCEYRRHFLSFRPRRIVLTSVEHDHQDYFPAYADILAAFVEYLRLLPPGGELIYCADDAGASEAAAAIRSERPDIALTQYGRAAEGPFRLVSYEAGEGRALFRLAGADRPFELRVPGRHLALDAAAAIALCFSLLRASRGGEIGARPADGRHAALEPRDVEAAAGALSRFSGSKRRSEILGEAGGVLFMDDYGHHPTAIRETIRGVKDFWPSRRLVVDFMSHTYSRTKALFGDFASCLDAADAVVMHGIYASAREVPDPTVSGESLFEAARARRASAGAGPTWYFERPMDAVAALERELRPGDLFLTMGAGDNWKLGEALLGRVAARSETR
jgi:UDP-N-acetylmuramate--alanine ligase